jgi:uncharacterized protein
MPVRSLNSSVFKWPDRPTVDSAARSWASREGACRTDLVRLGYFGSYARGDWGVGSDLDLVAVVQSSTDPFERRAISWDLTCLPVPADLLVYTVGEWRAMVERGGRFARTLQQETVWVYEAAGLREEDGCP